MDAEVKASELAQIGLGLGNYHASTGNKLLATGYYEKIPPIGLNFDVASWNLAVLNAEEGTLAEAIRYLDVLPATSLYYPEARAWAAQLRDRERQRALFEQKASIPAVSMWTKYKLPESVAVALFAIIVTLLLVPYFGGKEFGTFKIPSTTPKIGRALKLIGPVLMTSYFALFVPLIPGPSVSDKPTVETRQVFEGKNEDNQRYFQPSVARN